MTGLFVAVPYARPFEAEFLESLLFMHKPDEMYWSRVGFHPVAMARNILVERFLKQDGCPEYLLFVDSDATFAPESALRLMRYQLPMISGMIYKRRLPPIPAMGVDAGQNEEGYYLYDAGPVIQAVIKHVDRRLTPEDTGNAVCLTPGDDDLMEQDGVGMHFCLIRRDVFEGMKPPYFKELVVGAGEDFYFSRKVKEAGYKIHVDLGLHTGHLAGPGVDFGLRELLAFYRHTNVIAEHPRWLIGGGNNDTGVFDWAGLPARKS